MGKLLKVFGFVREFWDGFFHGIDDEIGEKVFGDGDEIFSGEGDFFVGVEFESGLVGLFWGEGDVDGVVGFDDEFAGVAGGHFSAFDDGEHGWLGDFLTVEFVLDAGECETVKAETKIEYGAVFDECE